MTDENKGKNFPALFPPTASELEKLREKAELYDKYISSYKEVQRARNSSALKFEALLENFRKLLLSVINIEDDLERAVAYAELEQNFQAVLSGLRPVIEKIATLLANEGVTRIDNQGELFNPQYHQVLDPLPAQHTESRIVVKKVLRPGFLLDGRVLRRAIVEVSLLDD